MLLVRPGGLEAAVTAADHAHPDETGGILLGWRGRDAVVIVGALEVPDIGASPHRYRRHHAVAQAALTAALAEQPDDSPLGYIGEWHVHPAHHSPSWQDRREIAAVSRLTLAAVGMVVIAGGPGTWELYALNGSAGRVVTASIVHEEEP
jgi:integrative and conjugative element protein (TIGR02256 family)